MLLGCWQVAGEHWKLADIVGKNEPFCARGDFCGSMIVKMFNRFQVIRWQITTCWIYSGKKLANI
jgi:hypothetical protein